MKWLAPLIVISLFFVYSFSAFATDGEETSDSIKKTYAALSRAVEAEDVDALFSHMTEQGQQSITGVSTLALMGEANRHRELANEIIAIFERHGLSNERMDAVFEKENNETKRAIHIGKLVKDRKAFMRDVLSFNKAPTPWLLFVGQQSIITVTGPDKALFLYRIDPSIGMTFRLIEEKWKFDGIVFDLTSPLRIMSFNIRYGTANDGENHWDKRKDFVVETIKAFKPDLLGTQETLAFQRDYILKNMEGYEAFGISREDGKDKGEMTTVFYRKDRFEKIEGATFWLSETPEVIASKGWDTSLPRICTWVKLRDLKVKDSPAIYFYNTHFDHRGPKARLESAKLIRQHIAALGADARIILTGDFNADEGSEPYKALFADQDGKASPVLDTLRIFKPHRGDDEGSFNSFGPTPGKARIDWVGVSKHWHIISAAIDRTQKNGRWPSDHFPVTAVIRAK